MVGQRDAVKGHVSLRIGIPEPGIAGGLILRHDRLADEGLRPRSGGALTWGGCQAIGEQQGDKASATSRARASLGRSDIDTRD